MEKPDLRVAVMKPAQVEQFKIALPDHIKAEFFTRAFLTTLNKTPKLRDCTQSSVMECLMSCAQLGLVPDGRRAHLIPFKDSCTLVIGYQGLLELVLRSGEISNVTVQAVCENDEFIWSTGDVTHSIDFRKPRGEAYAYYALATRKDGTRQAEVMTRSEVDRIRSMSQGRDSAAWSKHYDEMAKKTVFRRLAKWLPISSERFNQALDVDVEPDTPETPKFTVVESDPEPEADPGAIPQTTGLQAELTEHGITVETALKFLKVTTLAEAENAPEDKRRALIALNTTKKG